jgi:hypothetical protein
MFEIRLTCIVVSFLTPGSVSVAMRSRPVPPKFRKPTARLPALVMQVRLAELVIILRHMPELEPCLPALIHYLPLMARVVAILNLVAAALSVTWPLLILP